MPAVDGVLNRDAAFGIRPRGILCSPRLASKRPWLEGRLNPTLRVDICWVGIGWTVFNNKGKTVREFEPFWNDGRIR